MKTLTRLLCLFCLVAMTLPVYAGNTATVQVASGRQFRGQVDEQTSEASLVLRIGKPTLFVRRTIAWDYITAVIADGKTYSAAEFQRRIVAPDWQWAAETLKEEAPALLPEFAGPRSVPTFEPEVPPELGVPAVRGLHIEAYVANWDFDVEPDGLVVHVYPLDDFGQTVPALGTLQVSLIGDGATNRVSGTLNPLLGQWSQMVYPHDVGVNGAVFRFPFTWRHPDFSDKWSVASFGMVQARLAVGGQGVFEDTAAFTRIRQFSPVRDRLQQHENRRFTPSELTSYPYR